MDQAQGKNILIELYVDSNSPCHLIWGQCLMCNVYYYVFDLWTIDK